MRLLTQASLAIALAVVLAGVAVAPALQGEPFDSGPLIAYGQGDVLTYDDRWDRTVEYTVGPVRTVLGGDLEPVQAIPLTKSEPGQPPDPGSITQFVAVDEGGLAIVASYCAAFEDVECSALPVASWQPCASNIVIGGALTTLTREDLADPPVVIEDPDLGIQWTYEVDWENNHDVRLTRTDQDPISRWCRAPLEAVIDTKDQVIEVVRHNDGTTRLLSVDRGPGPLTPVGEANMTAKDFVPDDRPREDPFPPGAGDMGPPAWTLATTWERASRDSPEVRAYLEEHPEAFMFDTKDDWQETEALGGLYETGYYTWSMKMVGESAEAVEVTATKKVPAIGPPSYEYSVEPTEPPEHAATGLILPPEAGPDIDAFVEKAVDQGFEPFREEPGVFFAGVDRDANEARFVYGMALAPEDDQEGQPVRATQSFLSIKDTGRLSQLTADQATVEHVVRPG